MLLVLVHCHTLHQIQHIGLMLYHCFDFEDETVLHVACCVMGHNYHILNVVCVLSVVTNHVVDVVRIITCLLCIPQCGSCLHPVTGLPLTGPAVMKNRCRAVESIRQQGYSCCKLHSHCQHKSPAHICLWPQANVCRQCFVVCQVLVQVATGHYRFF